MRSHPFVYPYLYFCIDNLLLFMHFVVNLGSWMCVQRLHTIAPLEPRTEEHANTRMREDKIVVFVYQTGRGVHMLCSEVS